MKVSITLLVLFTAISAMAETKTNVPDAPSQLVTQARAAEGPRAAFISQRSAKPAAFGEKGDPHRRAFLLLSVAAGVATVADIEITTHCLQTKPNCREMNPLFGSHPSRGRLYATAVPLTLGQVWFSNYLRKKHPERKLWMLPTLSVTIGHTFGAMSGSF
jgi:hypothetical protein